MNLPILKHPQFNEAMLKKKGVSLVAFCDTVRKRKDDTCTVRLRIVHNRFPKYYSTKINLTEDDYLKLLGPRARIELKEDKVVIYELLLKAHDIISEMPEFSFHEFEIKFKSKKQNGIDDVYSWYEKKMQELKAVNKLSSHDAYRNSMKTLKDFTGRQKLSFHKITPAFLEKYEQWMTSKGRSRTTIGMYLRPLRHVYNNALNDKSKFITRDSYPFGQGSDKYSIPSPGGIKKALTKAEVRKIFDYQPENGSIEHFYRDIWLFSYLCNGINIKDICLLKYANIKGETIEYIRSKTATTVKKQRPIAIVITDDVKRIIDTWGNKPSEPKKYIFPLFEPGMKPEIQQKRLKQITKQCNKYIKRVACKVGVEKNISTYWARHSHANILRNAGVPAGFIGDGLGHTSTKTTDNYFASFEDEQRKENIEKLTDWD